MFDHSEEHANWAQTQFSRTSERSKLTKFSPTFLPVIYPG
jgi:hypothetical protein